MKFRVAMATDSKLIGQKFFLEELDEDSIRAAVNEHFAEHFSADIITFSSPLIYIFNSNGMITIKEAK